MKKFMLGLITIVLLISLLGCQNQLKSNDMPIIQNDETINNTFDLEINKSIYNSQDVLLSKMSLDPDGFIGTDTQKVQAAINSAITNNNSVIFKRIYIIDSSIIINKSFYNRNMLYLIGDGGGITKNNAGYIFITQNSFAGDIVSSHMKYSSTNGAGTTVWDGNATGGIIRLGSVFDSYINVDTVLSANSSYVQSLRFYGCTITGGNGWAFEWAKSYDTSIENCTIEHRDSAIRNTVFTGNPDNVNLRIVNNVIEGLNGKGLMLGSSFAVVIQGNYMEANANGYFDLSGSTYYHNGLSIIGNSIQQSPDQISANIPGFILGKMGTGGVQSSGNVALGILYELIYAGNNGRIIGTSDISIYGTKLSGEVSMYYDLGSVNTIVGGIEYGPIKKYSQSASVLFTAGETKGIEVDFTGITTVGIQDIVSLACSTGSGNYNFIIMNHYFSGTNKIIYNVKNESVGSQYITLYVNVLKIV